jgi:hypothetical protein
MWRDAVKIRGYLSKSEGPWKGHSQVVSYMVWRIGSCKLTY